MNLVSVRGPLTFVRSMQHGPGWTLAPIDPARPDPARQVERWVAERAKSVDERSGQLARAAELLTHARRLLPGAASLGPLEAAALELQELALAGDYPELLLSSTQQAD